VTLVGMVIDAIPPYKNPNPYKLLNIPCATNIHPPSFTLDPKTMLFVAIDSHCHPHNMHSEPIASIPKDDEVTYNIKTNFFR